MDIQLWGTNGKISKPEPSKFPVEVDLGGSGFGFTDMGICHIVKQTDLDEMSIPPRGSINGQ